MRATITEVRSDGLVVSVSDAANRARDAWLPSQEWAANPSEWGPATLSLEVGQELDVVPLPGPQEGRLVVSRKGFTLKAVDASMVNKIVDVKVTDIGKTLIRGTLGDNVPAVVTYRNHQAYLDWVASKGLTQELADHAVLGRGDVIRGFVKGVSDEHSSVSVNVSEYLIYMGREIAEAVTKVEMSPQEEREEEALPHRNLRAETIASISPVLLGDDNACRESIAKVLRSEGVEVHTLEDTKQAQDFLDALSSDGPGPSIPYRLAILDPNMEEHGTDLVGLRIAQELCAKTVCRVIVMTGEINNINKLDRAPGLGIYGYIEKPFTMDQLIEAIEEACELDKAIPLAEWITPDSKSPSPDMSVEHAPPAHDPEELTLRGALQSLAQLKQGTVVHVFQLHPRSYRARSLCASGPELQWERLRGKIAKSVIKDTAVDKELILETNASNAPSKHLWTLQMMKYQSFCGVPVVIRGTHAALVAFHPEASAFDHDFLMHARLTAEQAGRIIERQTLYETRRNEAELASVGMALASLAHELTSDMTALSARLRILGDLASNDPEDLSKREKALAALENVRRNVGVIATKTKVLRRAHARSDRVSIVECLRKAATACHTVVSQTIKDPERILIEEVRAPEGSWEVNASMASLIIVFFNLYLNAAQQIDLTSGVRKQGRIYNSLRQFTDEHGRRWARARVHDTGPGIHHDDWERVFDPGYSTKPDGSGLGLYICRFLLRDFSATISVTSSVLWAGTTVTVNLPLLAD
jgi:signal transduction histidine kinase/DNA-binding response OmpR family regulator